MKTRKRSERDQDEVEREYPRLKFLRQREAFLANKEERQRRRREEYAAMVARQELEDLALEPILRAMAAPERTSVSSAEATVALHQPQVGETREKRCVVCMKDFVAGGDKLRMMPCSHSFHQTCIFDWLYVSLHCPICRFAMPPSDEQRALEERLARAGDASPEHAVVD
uniref:RING-type domain-containing protein n=1 Tax=Leersia perrieri TaxID=77586 RepID=A0A0D9XNZ4_9ORYZ